jgi:hypothetical protein
MMLTDLLSSVRSALQENKTVPAVLDAFGQFLDNPTDWLRVNYDLSGIFEYIQENLEARFAEAVAKRSTTIVRNHIANFLQLCGGNMDRLKSCLREELKPYHEVVVGSILRRFPNLSPTERKAIYATLKLLERRKWIFQTNSNELMTASEEFERFFAAVKATSPPTEPLRFANLLVEKGLFNKLLLLTKNQDFNAFVPSLYVTENMRSILPKVSFPSESVLHTRLLELKQTPSFETIKKFLENFVRNTGIIDESLEAEVPTQLVEYLTKYDGFLAISPIDLDDIHQFLDGIARSENEEQRKREEVLRQQEVLLVSKPGIGATASDRGLQQEQLLEKPAMPGTGGPIYLGEELDLPAFVSALNRRATEKEILQLKVKSQFSFSSTEVVTKGVIVVGASGSGRSTTVKRLLDGLGANDIPTVILDGKGEHRGIAWKYKWNVYNFVKDSQAEEFRVSLFRSNPIESAEFVADLFEEYALQSGWPFSAEQRARLASIIRRVAESNPNVTLEGVLSEAANEAELMDFLRRLQKSILGGNISKIFTGDSKISFHGSLLFDFSGRGLRSPTTKEEREIASSLVLQRLVSDGISGKVIVIEDILDRVKSPSLQRDIAALLRRLLEAKNNLVASGRTSLRTYFGERRPIELVHRLAGQQTIEQEIQGLSINYSKSMLKNQIGFFPRGYCLVALEGRANLVRVKPVQFS